MRTLRQATILLASFLILTVTTASAADALPPKPTKYFNDYAGVTSPATQDRLNRMLEQFERESSSQIVVAIFQRLPQGTALEDFTVRTATEWIVGQKESKNGAVLFLFVADRRMRIEVGYGLEGKIPDALAGRIIEEQLRPALQRGDYDAALAAGVTSLIQAAKGEYKGTGRTVAEGSAHKRFPFPLLIFVALFILIAIAKNRNRGSVYGRRGYSRGGGWTTWGGGGSSGSWGGGGGGGFSGGGGSFGGGGASGRW